MSAKSGVASQVITLPRGGGALTGIGETFSPDPFTGTASLGIPLALPAGRNGFQPELRLVYGTGAGNGPFGLGWSLSVPMVSRKTSKGIPRYRDDADPAQHDTFLLSGAEDLVPVAEPRPGTTRYRPRTEGLFARVDRERAGGDDRWRVGTKDGLESLYGARAEGGDPAVIADPAHPGRIFGWKLSRTTDPFGNHIDYRYLRDRATDGPRVWDQLYLQDVRYVDHERDGRTRFLVSVTFVYDRRPDPYSEYRAGFEIRTRIRCRRIEIRTHADQDLLTRSYELTYLDERVAAGELPASGLPRNGVSLLSLVQLVGHDGDRRERLPALEFDYTGFAPERRRLAQLDAAGSLPLRSLASDELDVVDLFGRGLPDIVQLDGAAQFWRNLGGGRFDHPQTMDEVPAGVRLGDPGVQFADMNGDGRTDLLVLDQGGYFPLSFQGRWSREGFVRYPATPAVALGDSDLRLLDLDGDGVIDALRTGPSFELFFNDPVRGWETVETRPRGPLEAFPDLSFSDPRVKLADLTGSGLQDFVLVDQGRLDYWPYLGHGSWGRRVTMHDSPVFRDAVPLPGDAFAPERVLLGDLDGDGLDDVVYVEPDRFTFWINQGGEDWSEPTTVTGTPPLTDVDGVRLVDMLGTGMAGVLWSADALGAEQDNFQFLDLTGGRKPYLLERVDNHMGAVTSIRYAASTADYLADLDRPETRWRTPLPFPVQVVREVEVVDELSGGKLTSEYRYHHGYWDGTERELRGFGMVEQFDTQTFEPVDRALFSPPVLTRSWFHLGPVGDETAERTEADFSADYWDVDPPLLGRAPALAALLESLPPRARAEPLRALRGVPLRTEVYALDGSARAERPYTVTESQYSVREESPLATPAERRRRVFFPHLVARRTTQWERGDDPMTSFSFLGDHDELGQPRQETRISCPRGWRLLDDTPAQGYLATRQRTRFALPQDPDRHIRDRVAVATTFELRNSAGRRVADLAALPGTSPDLAVIAHTVNHYDGPAFTGLPAGRVGRFGALTRRASLVLTEEVVRDAYGADGRPPYLRADGPAAWTEEYPPAFRASLPALAGYVFEPGDEAHVRGWYTQGERVRYDFQAAPERTGRGMRVAVLDELATGEEQAATIGYDRFDLLPVEVGDPVCLVTRAEHDYRALQVRLVTDANGNQTVYGFTPLGLLQETRVRGSPEQVEGDRAEPSLRMEYRLGAFDQSPPGARQPVSVHTIRRVHHDTDVGVPAAARDQTTRTVEFTDGFGRLLQTRTRAEEVVFGDPVHGGALLPAAQEPAGPGSPVVGVVNRDPQRPNVIVSGWQTYDNKGRVVERFEPFYATGFDYAAPGEEQLGQRTTLVRDPLGRVERTVGADGSVQQVVFGVPVDLADPSRLVATPWESFTYDPNDSAGRTHGEAARAFAHHWDTPRSAVVDALGRVVESVDRNGPDPQDRLALRWTYDIRGDPLTVTDALGRRAFSYVRDLAGNPLRVENLDAGVSTVVLDAAGAEVERRDAKGALVLHAYDVLHRPTRSWARDGAGGRVSLRERLAYGDGGRCDQPPGERAVQRARNRLGRLHRHHDEAGLRILEAYDFKGNLVETVRQVVADEVVLGVFPAPSEPSPDWRVLPWRADWEPPEGRSLEELAAALLDPVRYETSMAYDAQNRLVSMRCPKDVEGSRRTLRLDYDRGGNLERVRLDTDPFVERIAYDAAGRRTLLALGNGVMTRYAYHPRTFRLARMRSERFIEPALDPPTYRPTGPPLQDHAFTHDLVGNVLALQDRTPGCGVAPRPDELDRRFAYDPIYRLVSATGRAHAAHGAGRPWEDRPGSADLTEARHATETYTYDPVGNLLQLRHVAGNGGNGGGFTRNYEQVAGSDRLRSLHLGADPAGSPAYTYDAAGNLTDETTSRHFEWDHRDLMKAFRTQVDAAEPSVHAQYLYDADGERIKKVVRRQGGQVESTTYVDVVFEHHRWQAGNRQQMENNHLHVMDGQHRLAQVRVGPAQPDDPGPAIQHHLADHLGSPTVVLDQDGNVVSREEFSPYGETSFGTFARKRYRFTGKERDEESGLSYHGARFYAPWLARWASVDPEAGSSPRFSSYCYAFDNPLRFTDPSGGQPDPKELAAQVGPFLERVKEIREEHGDLIRQAGEFRGTRTDVKGSIEGLEMLDKGLETADDAASTAVKEGEDLAKRLMAADDPYRPRFPREAQDLKAAIKDAKQAAGEFGAARGKVLARLSKFRGGGPRGGGKGGGSGGGGGGGRSGGGGSPSGSRFVRFLGIGSVLLGAAFGTAAIRSASPGQRAQVAAEEVGAFGGGLLGGAIGGAVGGGLTAVLMTNPGGWIVVGAIAGSVSLGHVGSEAGRWAGRKVLQGTREFVEGVNTLGEFQIDMFWKKARSKHPGCPPEVCRVPDDPDEDFYRRGGHLEKENRLQRRPF